jgi:FtsP/CotA-like multicopper oxidase with cupredoxin domain
VELNRLPLGPGERAEIVVAFDAGQEVIMRSFTSDLGSSGGSVGGEDTIDLLQIRAAASLEHLGDLPSSLGGISAPDITSVLMERTFQLEGHGSINGVEMDMARIDEVIPAGALEIWNVESNGLPHTFHIHGATFHVLDVNGSEPTDHLRGPKDTVFVGSNHSVRLAVQFLEYTNPDMPYMYHCHILRHEDNGMMGQFVVVEPGTENDVDRIIEMDHHH